jgi:hypothetical protein
MPGREVEEGGQRVAILGRALDGLGVPGPALLGEDRDGRHGARPIRRVAHLAQRRRHARLHGPRHLVEQVGRLVHPGRR